MIVGINELIEKANSYIEEGESVYVHTTIDNSLVLEVFKGDKWTGGEWQKVAKTADGAFFGATPSRKYKCNRKFVVLSNGSLGLTPCAGECIVETRPGKFVDYTKICDLRG